MRSGSRGAAWAWPIAFALLLVTLVGSAHAQDFPPLSGRVVDAADILSPETEAALSLRLQDWEREASDQLVVATVPSLQGYEVSDYGYRLGRAWGIGVGEDVGGDRLDNGVLFLVAPNEREVAIEVGYGLEGTLTDTEARRVIEEAVLPAFREGDFDRGVTEGVVRIIGYLGATPEEAAERRRRAGDRPIAEGAGEGGVPWPLLIFLVFFLISLRPRRRRRRTLLDAGGRRGSGWDGAALPWIILGSGMGRGSPGAFGGGGFSSGGFGGGGGSFGGGGASGSW
jgi:uncharacterized protein